MKEPHGQRVNHHWEEFVQDVPWFLKRDQIAEVEDSRPAGSWAAASSDFHRLFPEISGVLQGAVVTSVIVSGLRYQLYTWLRPRRHQLRLALAAAVGGSTSFS
jgi:hypothetical protein